MQIIALCCLQITYIARVECTKHVVLELWVVYHPLSTLVWLHTDTVTMYLIWPQQRRYTNKGYLPINCASGTSTSTCIIYYGTACTCTHVHGTLYFKKGVCGHNSGQWISPIITVGDYFGSYLSLVSSAIWLVFSWTVTYYSEAIQLWSPSYALLELPVVKGHYILLCTNCTPECVYIHNQCHVVQGMVNGDSLSSHALNFSFTKIVKDVVCQITHRWYAYSSTPKTT